MITSRETKDIFTFEKAGLFLKCTPDKTLPLKGESCSGRKQHYIQTTHKVRMNTIGWTKHECFRKTVLADNREVN